MLPNGVLPIPEGGSWDLTDWFFSKYDTQPTVRTIQAVTMIPTNDETDLIMKSMGYDIVETFDRVKQDVELKKIPIMRVYTPPFIYKNQQYLCQSTKMKVALAAETVDDLLEEQWNIIFEMVLNDLASLGFQPPGHQKTYAMLRLQTTPAIYDPTTQQPWRRGILVRGAWVND